MTPISDDAMTPNETYVLLRESALRKSGKRTDENRLSGRKNCKRIRSPTIGDKSGPIAKKIKQTPVSKKQNRSSTSNTPRSARKVLEGIEKGLSLARSALTPRRSAPAQPQPAVLCGKDLCNVSSTSSTSPDEVLSQLRSALDAKGIICNQKGFVITIVGPPLLSSKIFIFYFFLFLDSR